MRVGVTEYGDAGLDFRWEDKLPTVDGAILITKSLNPVFQQKVLSHVNEKPIIVHCTCTGWGGTVMEPNVPDYKTQLNFLKQFIDAGFPTSNIVLRIDPIFPTDAGLRKVLDMLQYFHSLGLPEEQIRYRMSIVDKYPHVRKRYTKAGFKPMYNGNFYPSWEQMDLVGQKLSTTPYLFSTCAEDKLAAKFPKTFKVQGCCSKEDLALMNIQYDDTLFENPQKRSMCHCLSCKQELLNNPRLKCGHNCLYCFWKD